MPYAEVCGARLFYEDVGEGTPLLLLPGALGTGRSDFGPQLDALPRRGVRVISPDPRGYGKSRPPRRDFPIDFYQRDARDFATLMETLDCPRYALGGWSDGAITSLFLALDRPACVSRLALWGGNAYVTQDDIDAYETTRSVADWSSRAAAPMQELYGDDFQPLWSGWCDVQQALLAAGGDLWPGAAVGDSLSHAVDARRERSPGAGLPRPLSATAHRGRPPARLSGRQAQHSSRTRRRVQRPARRISGAGIRRRRNIGG